MHANVTITHYVSQALILVIIKHVFCFLHISRKDNYNPPVTRWRMSLVFQTEPLRLVSKYNFSFTFYTLRVWTENLSTVYSLLHIFCITIPLSRMRKNVRSQIPEKTFRRDRFLSWVIIKSLHWYEGLHFIYGWWIKELIQKLVLESEKASSGNRLPSSSWLFHSFDRRQKESRIL